METVVAGHAEAKRSYLYQDEKVFVVDASTEDGWLAALTCPKDGHDPALDAAADYEALEWTDWAVHEALLGVEATLGREARQRVEAVVSSAEGMQRAWSNVGVSDRSFATRQQTARSATQVQDTPPPPGR